MGTALSSLSQWFPCVCQSSFCLSQVSGVDFQGMFYHWRIPQQLFLESKLLIPPTEECHRGLTSALNCKEEQCDMFRMASFERGFENHFYLPKNLKPQWGVTQPKMVYWHSAPCCAMASTRWHQTFSQLKGFFPEEDIYLVLFSKEGEPVSLGDLRPGSLVHRTRIWMEIVSVNNSGEHSFFSPSFLHPLSSDLLTERQVGVGVQVTGAAIVAISVTQLTARSYSAVCATGRERNNGCDK